ncbi:hypothetical protein B6N60_02220 [Richelia sinica FACHB-800]|uniref:Uncharacterized protein n=1 Tax=Richelia sinica FACHB-800 TaxID=1357546 RepID=A0A975T7K1_9NOST|nr:hypothetical protein B6N60_02220 [Richelia sinica FACHB-800]
MILLWGNEVVLLLLHHLFYAVSVRSPLIYGLPSLVTSASAYCSDFTVHFAVSDNGRFNQFFMFA